MLNRVTHAIIVLYAFVVLSLDLIPSSVVATEISTTPRTLNTATTVTPIPHPFNYSSVQHLLRCQQSKVRLAACAIMRDPHPDDLVEWVWYHKWLGIEHFFITEHKSNTMYPVLKPFIDLGFVTYNHSEINVKPQLIAYKQCISNYNTSYDFMAFFNADEYIVMTPNNSYTCLGDFVAQYQDYGALAMNWLQFGYSGHMQRPHGGTLGNYVQCLSKKDTAHNRHIKIIANLKYVVELFNPHEATYTDHKYAVNEHFERPMGPLTKHTSWDYILVHHYQVKSRWDFEQRLNRQHPTPAKIKDNFFELKDNKKDFCWRGVELFNQCCFKLFYDT
eukprot:TRINITY_DN4875_c1_g1_i2.p1 TRINITY_DN4875_c1_g1~~TRINITY_DN4875_c1_g1_i2.p1  ORF type:complete len:332 (+),score=11.12 TRINITY_DN4875_c1_g1_i2:128-1123(+)